MDYDVLRSLMSTDAYWSVNKQIARTIWIECAILLQDIVDKYWYFKSQWRWVMIDWKMYFYNTAENIEKDTTISYKLQKKHLLTLQKLWCVTTKLCWLPAKLHFTIDVDKILLLVKHSIDQWAILDLPIGQSNNNKDINNKDKNKDNNIYTDELPNEELSAEESLANEKEINICEEVLEHRNTKWILKHQKVSPVIKKHILARKNQWYTVEDMKKAIDVYAEVVHCKDCFFSYKRALNEFMQREWWMVTFLEKSVDNYRKTPVAWENKPEVYDDTVTREAAKRIEYYINTQDDVFEPMNWDSYFDWMCMKRCVKLLNKVMKYVRNPHICPETTPRWFKISETDKPRIGIKWNKMYVDLRWVKVTAEYEWESGKENFKDKYFII